MITKFALYQNDKIVVILCLAHTDRHNQVLSCASLAKCKITANAKFMRFIFYNEFPLTFCAPLSPLLRLTPYTPHPAHRHFFYSSL